MIVEQGQQAMQYWLTRFRQQRDGSSFPPDRPRTAARSHSRARAAVQSSAASWSKFVAVCNRERTEPSHAVLGILQILIHRYTLTDTIEIGAQIDRVLSLVTEIMGASTVRESLCLLYTSPSPRDS